MGCSFTANFACMKMKRLKCKEHKHIYVVKLHNAITSLYYTMQLRRYVTQCNRHLMNAIASFMLFIYYLHFIGMNTIGLLTIYII